MTACLTAIATATPPFKISQKEVPELLDDLMDLNTDEKKLLKKIYKSTGIDYRHSVLPDGTKEKRHNRLFPNENNRSYPCTQKRMTLYKENALNLAITAIKQCIDSATITKKNITHLITVSCTGMYAPGLDIEIAQMLQLNTDIERTAINFMGCYGAFNGLKAANAICLANNKAKVLVICVEICTIHFQETLSLDNIVTNAIFSDGAACALVEGNTNSKTYLSLNQFHCDLLPQSNQEMAWHIGNNGFDIVLSSYVPHLIESGIQGFSQKLLAKAKLTFDKINHFAIHPGGKRILEACEHALGISKEDNTHSYQVLKEYGNMSSATVLFVLDKILKGIKKSNDKQTVFSCAFGPGLTLESALLEMHYC